LSAIAIVPSGQEAAFLADLPLEDLPVSVEMRRRLRLLGLRTLRDLARLPKGAVAAQFGAEGARAWELAHGIDHSPIVPYRPPKVIVERLAFPAPVDTLDPLVAAARTLLQRALSRSEARGRAARGLRLSVETEDGRVWKREVTFREPVGSGERMLVALRPRIEAGAGDGSPSAVPAPFVQVELALLDLCGESALQGKLFGGEWGHGPHVQAGERLAAAARQLKARYGRPVLGKVMEVEPWSRLPERRFALIDYDP
jgi:DNA polymerase-4/protein ImuB